MSTSGYACKFILKEIKNESINNVLIVGFTHVAERLIPTLKRSDIKYSVIERTEEKVEDLMDEEPITVGDAKDGDNLKAAGIDQATGRTASQNRCRVASNAFYPLGHEAAVPETAGEVAE